MIEGVTVVDSLIRLQFSVQVDGRLALAENLFNLPLPLPPLPPLHPSHKHWQASSPPTVASAWVNRARADVRACVMGGGSCGGGACRVVMAAVVGAGVKGVLKSLREGAVCTSKRAVSYV